MNILKFIELFPIELIDRIYTYTDFLTAFSHKLVSDYTLKHLFRKSRFNKYNSIQTVIHTQINNMTKLRVMFYVQDQLNLSINLEDFLDTKYDSGLHPFYNFYKKYILKKEEKFSTHRELKRKDHIYLGYKKIKN